MSDLSEAIQPKADQLTADDLIAGPLTIRITEVSVVKTPEQPVAISFDGDGGKPWKPCKTMTRVLVQMWGPDSAKFRDRSVTLYRDDKVKWGGLEVGGIRISHMSHINGSQTMALTVTRGSKRPFTVQPLAAERAPEPKKQPTISEWLGKLEANLSAADSSTALETVLAQPSVQKAGTTLQNGDKARYDAMVTAARARFAAPMDEPPPDDGFPGDAPPTNPPIDSLIAEIEACENEALLRKWEASAEVRVRIRALSAEDGEAITRATQAQRMGFGGRGGR